MGRRALRTGDLVQPKKYITLLLWDVPIEEQQSTVVVQRFKFGLLIGKSPTAKTPRGVSVTSALILDSKTGLYGWCDLTMIKKVE